MSTKDDITTVTAGEEVLHIVHQRIGEGSEAYVGPLIIGKYSRDEGDPVEVWIECEGARINILQRYLRDVIRLLKSTGGL